MRMLFGLVLVVGLALAGGAVYLAQGFISKTQTELAMERAEREKAGPLVQVYVVNKPLNYGDALTKEDVQLIYWPESALPETVFRDEALLFPEGDKGPRFVKRPMEQYDPVLAVRVTEPGQAAGLADELAEGMSAFTIKFDGAGGMSRYLEAGDNVDIYWTGSRADVSGDITQLIETTVRIIAVDRPAAKEGETNTAAPKNITVEATREQVARLTQGQASGQLTVSLVGRNDTSTSGPIEVDDTILTGSKAPVIEQVEAEQVCTIRTRKGDAVIETPIPCTN
ncbi:MAG: Flp pilus assembly protein CpaB [Paracoccaceae bacterium]